MKLSIVSVTNIDFIYLFIFYYSSVLGSVAASSYS